MNGMIRTENVTINGKQFVRTYSDSGCMIERDGVLYAEAIDPIDSGRVYTESDTPIELTAEEALDIIVNGGKTNA